MCTTHSLSLQYLSIFGVRGLEGAGGGKKVSLVSACSDGIVTGLVGSMSFFHLAGLSLI